jgi:8-oxo-dGTP pyrophosphatase MutT (NUDIX family)
MSAQRLLNFADSFVLSSGTVSIDLKRDLVLLLYYRPTKEFLLPKGRKNVGETLQAAAIRETFEESGYGCHLLQHSLPTNAPSLSIQCHNEPIAVQQRVQNGVRKMIFWYIAEVDSSGSAAPDTQEEGEDFDVRWAPTREAAAMMTFADDKDIVAKAVAAVVPLQETLTSPLARKLQTL